MPYFLSDKNLALNQEVVITGEEAGHILLSHRVRKGEKIKLQGPDGKRFLAEVVLPGKKEAGVKILEILPVPKEPEVFLTLYQSVVSEKALDFIFQKGTELGLGKIVLFNSANSATKLSENIFLQKQLRWNKILTEAAKQSERAKWPELEFANDLKRVMQKAAALDKIFLADISGTPLKAELNSRLPIVSARGGSASGGNSLAIIVGPEGGFAESEINILQTLKNLQTVSLGPILLRADTAALAIVAIIRLWAI